MPLSSEVATSSFFFLCRCSRPFSLPNKKLYKLTVRASITVRASTTSRERRNICGEVEVGEGGKIMRGKTSFSETRSPAFFLLNWISAFR